MKRVFSIILSLCICVSILFIPQNEANAYYVGEVIGQVVYTDITAWIDDYQIPAYACNGGMIFIAEDLRYFGFDINYDNSQRALFITQNDYNPSGVGYVDKNNKPIGSYFADWLYTDIKVYIQGRMVPSYAINGYSLIKLEDLSFLGNFDYNNDTRKASLETYKQVLRKASSGNSNKGASDKNNSSTNKTKVISGTVISTCVSETSSNGLAYNIWGEEYDLADDYYSKDRIKAGSNGKFEIDSDGKIISFIAKKTSDEDTNLNSNSSSSNVSNPTPKPTRTPKPTSTPKKNDTSSDISIVDSGQCGENLYYTLDDGGTLTISGKGTTYSDMVVHTQYPWFENRMKVKKLIIERGVTGIGGDAFGYFKNMTSVTISGTVKRIESFAFAYCTSLTSIDIPEGVTYIGLDAFMNCSSLKTVYLPGSINVIDHYSFNGCDSLKTVYYDGTSAQFNNIDIGDSNNDPLFNATIKCNDKSITMSNSSINSNGNSSSNSNSNSSNSSSSASNTSGDGTSRQTAKTIGENDSKSGYLDSDNQNAWYKINITKTAELNISCDVGAELAVYLYLYAENGSSSFDNAYGKDKRLEVTEGLQPGTYYIKISRSNGDGSFSLSTNTQYVKYSNILNDSYKNATDLGYIGSASKSAALGYYASNGDRNSEDWYKIEVSRNSTVNISCAVDENLSAYIYLYDQNGSKSLSSNYGKNKTLTISKEVESGTYYIKVLHNNGYGCYDLKVKTN